jgi:glycosyltransferase involved in cell wall biosynthesis
MDAVIAGNSYLADWLSQYCKNVSIVPTAIDCARFRPRSDPREPIGPQETFFTIGWTGTSGNFRFLSLIEKALARFLQSTSRGRLRIVADRRPNLPMIPDVQLEFVPWSPDNEASEVARFDVGLMPLADDPWSRGKCSFKMLQYMASGLPVVVSPVGMNAEVLGMGDCGLSATTDDEWLDALCSLRDDAERRAAMGKIARDIVVDHFDVPVVARQLSRVFHDTVGR